MVWDEDINPEGAALKYRFDFLPETWWTEVNIGFLVLDEIGSVNVTQTSTPGLYTTRLPNNDDRDPYVMAYQISTHVKLDDWLQVGPARLLLRLPQPLGPRRLHPRGPR